MITRITNYIFSTDSLPVIGGTVGAVSQISPTKMFPPFEVLVYTIIVAAVGAAVGYLVKLLLDLVVQNVKRNNGNPPTEYR